MRRENKQGEEMRRIAALFFFVLACLATACREEAEKGSVRPLSLRDVPAQRLAFSFKPDISGPALPSSDDPAKTANVQRDFETPGPPDEMPETVAPMPAPSVGPAFPPVPAFSTEQIYVCNRDGTDLHPLTTRDGLIYFHFAWSPDARALAALACKREEWDENEAARQAPAGRPRLITLDGGERLLDDGLKDALPVWSPDSSKIATAFDTDVFIYDAVAKTPTAARISLRDSLRAASAAFDAQHLSKNRKTENSGGKANDSAGSAAQPSAPPKSFAPIIRLEWSQPESLFIQTGYIRIYPGAAEYPRWHELHLSPQAAVISRADLYYSSRKSLRAAVLN
jgi:hypothetical protein